ncbi:MAG TPA: transposase, partial [Urbifossiella sp.]|nr:transposase [Urbifossiella sp.]
PAGPITRVGDETVDGHPGRTIDGKARHRDPTRSSKTYTAWRYGHTWVVLAVRVTFPFATRPWALPVRVDLYRDEAANTARKRPRRTPVQLMCRLLRLRMIHRPGRTVVFAGDAGFGRHEVARFCHRHRGRRTRVRKPHPKANRYDPPAAYRGRGRPPAKGPRRPKPADAAGPDATRDRLTVGWYGGGKREVGVVTPAVHGYQAGNGLVPVRWASVRDRTGTHRDEILYTTDPALTPTDIIGYDCGRWNIEITFQDLRAHLGLETTRGRCEKTVTRAAPCLFGRDSVVAPVDQA